jgi:transaldolase/glucose-6-phosphate isomerase
MGANPLVQLGQAGQAVWLDFVQRKMLDDRELAAMTERDGVTGVTSNPSIFEKAIGSGDYDGALKVYVEKDDAEPAILFERLAVEDIQAAADQLRPVYDAKKGRDGYVSLEVSPYLAMDTEGSLTEARRLWKEVDRPNLMIKIPGTHAGVPAIRTLIGEGINVNVTLLFGLDAYLAVAEAYMDGLEDLAAKGGDISKLASVASFFVSRIDSKIDGAIDAKLKAGAGADEAALKAVRGKVAIANAKIAYQHYLKMTQTPRWKALAAKGAGVQRLLWASTGTKDPSYSDVLYVETLVGPDTVNTMPPKTMDAFRDHGTVAESLTQDIAGAEQVLAETKRVGLDLDGVTKALVDDGVKQFADAADGLYAAVADKRIKALGEGLNGQSFTLPDGLKASVEQLTEKARAEAWTRRLWNGDAGLWTGADEAQWLGWLGAGKGEAIDLAALDDLNAKVKGGGFTHVLLLGMGGSSLGPEVLGDVCHRAKGSPSLLVLDSTDPTQIARFESDIDPAKTLFVVSSKSGTTLEPDILHRYFFQVAAKAVGADKAAGRFVAVTDPGSKLEATAKSEGFLRLFHGDKTIGGRFSVLSNFGMVPAIAAGVDVAGFMERTQVMVRACAVSAPPKANPGVELGLVLGAGALAGRDKVTILASPALAPVGAWLEQLIAESTGKIGKGLIPVAGEAVGKPDVYGKDRVFAYLALKDDADAEQARAVAGLEAAGQPVVRITLASAEDLGQEFFRWEIATAVAGAVIGIDPFDQPDVEASKIKTRALTDAYEQSGAMAPETPFVQVGGFSLFADAHNADALRPGKSSLAGVLAAHFKRAGAGDYLGLLAYIDRDPAHVAALAKLQAKLRDATGCAVVVGFGPRFLHSTGQAYKGGPNTGVFLEITADHKRDLQVPGRKFSFGVVEAAQARGDLGVLDERGRRTLRVHLGADVDAGLKTLAAACEEAVGKVSAH